MRSHILAAASLRVPPCPSLLPLPFVPPLQLPLHSALLLTAAGQWVRIFEAAVHTHAEFFLNAKGNSIRGLCISHCSAIICWPFSLCTVCAIKKTQAQLALAWGAGSTIDFDLCTVNTRHMWGAPNSKFSFEKLAPSVTFCWCAWV